MKRRASADSETKCRKNRPAVEPAATPEQQRSVFAAFDELGTQYLKPVFEHLNGALQYDELKLLRLSYLSMRQE